MHSEKKQFVADTLDHGDSDSTDQQKDDRAEQGPSEQSIVSPAEIESEESGEATLGQVLAGVERHEMATAQWFEVVRGDLGVLYEHLDFLVKSVQGEVPPTSAPAANPPDAPSAGPAVTESPPVAPVEVPVSQHQPVAREEPSLGGFASRMMAAAAGPNDDGAAWESIIFGQTLAADTRMSAGREEVISGLKGQEPAAMALAGTLLEVRSAPDDRVPQLLKDVGEAYYRWQPVQGSGGDDFRDALTDWLEAMCDAIGSGNRIELVRIGDRYDSTRHNAKTRGVEVSDVHGWVVLRDNGKVYTKANVAVM